mmetsp:Transcript_10374/g.24986  ORF Transcript_10374/g.24986 Transcript_10374/m.24986 type:complete len:250 (-) Transcript_10374:201-950(-)
MYRFLDSSTTSTSQPSCAIASRIDRSEPAMRFAAPSAPNFWTSCRFGSISTETTKFASSMPGTTGGAISAGGSSSSGARSDSSSTVSATTSAGSSATSCSPDTPGSSTAATSAGTSSEVAVSASSPMPRAACADCHQSSSAPFVWLGSTDSGCFSASSDTSPSPRLPPVPSTAATTEVFTDAMMLRMPDVASSSPCAFLSASSLSSSSLCRSARDNGSEKRLSHHSKVVLLNEASCCVRSSSSQRFKSS